MDSSKCEWSARGEARGWGDILAVGLAAAALVLCFGQWLDFAHLPTTNGLWKSVRVTEWKADFRQAPLDPSNYLYYPAMALIGRLFDLLGIHAGVAWRQLVVINGLFAGLAIGFLYWMVRALTGRRDIALFAGLFHLGGAYFICLAVADEDILPSSTLVLGAMAMAAVWFASPRVWQVVVVAVFFTLGWLTEWRLIFPALPPLLAALALSRGPLTRRAGLILLFLATNVGLALLAANRWEGHLGAVALPYLFWTGKGIDTGWAGFSLEKLAVVPAGMGEYTLGGHSIVVAHLFTAAGAEWAVAFVLQMLLLAYAVQFFWRRRHDPAMRSAAIVFLGTLGAGEVMNAYSQPGDPQMQINVMPWLTLAAALLVASLMTSLAARRRAVALSVAVALALLMLAYNVAGFSRFRGLDKLAEAQLSAVEKLADPASTVYVYLGLESIVTWHFVTWDQHWEGVCDVGRSPQPGRKFKWISLFGPLVHHPRWTTEEYLAALKAEFDCAFDKGYRVIVGPTWNYSIPELADALTIVSKGGYAPALHAFIHGYADERLDAPDIGPYFELKRP